MGSQFSSQHSRQTNYTCQSSKNPAFLQKSGKPFYVESVTTNTSSQRLDEVFDQDVKNEAKISLSRLVSNGDLQAIKYYNELTNIYRPEQNDPNRMVAVILTAVMEILATHVSSEILSKIAAEIRTSPSVTKVINAIEVGGR